MTIDELLGKIYASMPDISTMGEPLQRTGSALKDAWMQQNALQKMGILPVVGDVAGFAGDVQEMVQDPAARTWSNAGLAGAGLLPFVPAGLGMVKKTFPETLYRGTSEGVTNPTGIKWATPDKELANRYAGERANPYVEIIKGEYNTPLTFRHADQRKKPSELLSEVMNQSDAYKGNKDAATLYKKIIGNNKVDEINKLLLRDDIIEFIKLGGFDHIKVPEKGIDTYGLIPNGKGKTW